MAVAAVVLPLVLLLVLALAGEACGQTSTATTGVDVGAPASTSPSVAPPSSPPSSSSSSSSSGVLGLVMSLPGGLLLVIAVGACLLASIALIVALALRRRRMKRKGGGGGGGRGDGRGRGKGHVHRHHRGVEASHARHAAAHAAHHHDGHESDCSSELSSSSFCSSSLTEDSDAGGLRRRDGAAGRPSGATLRPGKPSDATKLKVTLGKPIGKGNFGVVYLATTPNGAEVAVKQMVQDQDAEAEAEFRKELAVMLHLDSKRIVRLYGITKLDKSVGGGLGLVMEYCSRGALDGLLQKSVGQIPAQGLLQLCVHIAEGLAYLAGMNVLHRDMAARNVLVDAMNNCKLADFGLSRTLEDDDEIYVTTSAFPVRWSAPELLLDHEVSKASDVYSLGITMFEVFSFGEIPFKAITGNMRIAEAICDNHRPKQPESCPDEVWSVVTHCWSPRAEDRPTAGDAAAALLNILMSQAAADDASRLQKNYSGSFIVQRDESSKGLGRYKSTFNIHSQIPAGLIGGGGAGGGGGGGGHAPAGSASPLYSTEHAYASGSASGADSPAADPASSSGGGAQPQQLHPYHDSGRLFGNNPPPSEAPPPPPPVGHEGLYDSAGALADDDDGTPPNAAADETPREHVENIYGHTLAVPRIPLATATPGEEAEVENIYGHIPLPPGTVTAPNDHLLYAFAGGASAGSPAY